MLPVHFDVERLRGFRDFSPGREVRLAAQNCAVSTKFRANSWQFQGTAMPRASSPSALFSRGPRQCIPRVPITSLCTFAVLRGRGVANFERDRGQRSCDHEATQRSRARCFMRARSIYGHLVSLAA